ncbi:MAG: TIM-barrel domain-containing protein [Paludibacteraceae bacterium]
MKTPKLLLLILAVSILSACGNATFKHISNGIVVKIQPHSHVTPGLIRLQVVNAKIIRVSATPENNFSNAKSLIVVSQKNKTDFTVEEKNGIITLNTDSLSVTVNKKSGEIGFYNLKGEIILQENKGGGKSFSPIEVEGTKGYTVRQIFESPDKEAFYGLGQHQSDEFNYKGKNESLFQYNTKVSVPFIVSNKNYGILWDNYSLSKFGDSRDYAELDQFKLYDAEGKEGGLTATYTPKEVSKATIKRTESKLNYENLTLIKNFPKGFELNNATVTWQGEIESAESGLYHFLLHYAGYVKVYFNNKLVVKERWRTAWNPNDYKFTYNMETGKKISIRIEWKPDGGVSYMALKALSPLPATEQNKLSLWSEMGDEIDYYFVYGHKIDDVISGYRTLTGKSQIMPKWAMGFWQSRERYKTQFELVNTLKEFRNKKIGIDNIVQDWFYWPETEWGSHKFDPARFPDPKAMVDSVHMLNAKIMISVWPKFYVTTEHFKQFDNKGWMYRQAVKDSIRDWVGPGYIGSFYDAYSEGARKLFWKQMEDNLYPKGFDAWWMDASEPNVQDNTDMAYRKKLCGPTALGPSAKYFNAYALMNAQSIYEGQRGINPDKRVFLLTRSGFAGIQRYSTAIWSGDIGTRWEDMKAQISAGLNFAISGIPYWTMDIGGFCVEKRYENGQHLFDSKGIENEDLKEWRELNARWYQFGTFLPLYRAHGQFPLREPFNIAPENHPAFQTINYYNKLRYRLMPYIYSLAGMTYFNDFTIMRALVMDYGKDTNVNNISDQYMFGNSLMVCPVYEYKATKRDVYFPVTNGWYDFYTGKFITGGNKLTVDAPYSRIPLYVPEGAIIPFGPEIQYTDEKKPESITLYVYGGRNGTFTLYEDEGVNYNYEKGAYTMINFKYDETAKTLKINDRKGTFRGVLKERKFNIILVNQSSPKVFDPDAEGIVVIYNGTEQTIKL